MDATFYETCLSLDMRPFDSNAPDLGVPSFLDRLGFIPTKILFHSSGLDRVHCFDGAIDTTYLMPMHVSQRGMPGGQFWTRLQYKRLVERLQASGIKVYQGTIPIRNDWQPYPGKVQWLYDNLPELFVTFADGSSSIENEPSTINPLRTLNNGTPYVELLARDVRRFLSVFELDGYFAADGLAGLIAPLSHMDFAPDMLRDFSGFLNEALPCGKVPEKADWILRNRRYEWSVFYSERWAEFYRLLCAAVHDLGKDVIAFSPMREGPGSSFYNRGFHYGKVAAAGLRTVCLESFETLGRIAAMQDQWAPKGICELATIRAQAPELKVIWTAAFANIPEHWNSLRDVPNLFERECFSIPTTTVYTADGLQPAVAGVQTIWGNDVTAGQWAWAKERLDIGFGWRVAEPAGPALVWSDAIMHEHCRRGSHWPLAETACRVHFAGIPIHTAGALAALVQARARSLLLIEPLGIGDDEVALLKKAVNDGASLVVMGAVEHPELLALLGLQITSANADCRGWTINAAFRRRFDPRDPLPAESGAWDNPLGGVTASGAESFIDALDDRGNIAGTVAAMRFPQGAKGCCAWLRLSWRSMPPLGNQAPWARNSATRRRLESLAAIYPDSFTEVCTWIIHWALPFVPRNSYGQIRGFRTIDGEQILLLENIGLPLYAHAYVHLPGEAIDVAEHQIRHIGPVGYLEYRQPNASAIIAAVPPDACLALRIRYRNKEALEGRPD
jgi:hypothetical protein